MKDIASLVSAALLVLVAYTSHQKNEDMLDEIQQHKAALIEAHKNYQAALDENIELQTCREVMWSTVIMANEK